MRPDSLPELEPLRRETFEGLELASDPAEREHEADFVLGAGPASRLLARLTIRRHASAVLDLGTGSGVQALLASRHADRVVAVDVNKRALAISELNAKSNGIENVEWREGSWLEPVRGERFDLVISNPPYVISPDSSHAYRDSGEHMDALVLRLLAEIPGVLEDGGFAQVLCSWVVGVDGDWRSTIETAVAGSGCDVILIRYSLEEPAAYAERWHERLAEVDPPAHRETIDRWVAHYAANGVEAFAFGIVVLRRRQAERNWFRAIAAPGSPHDAAGNHVLRLFEGWDWARAAPDRDIAVTPAPGGRILRRLDLEEGTERITLEVRPHAGFAARIDERVATALARRNPLPAADAKRLVGLGLLLTEEQRSRKIGRS